MAGPYDMQMTGLHGRFMKPAPLHSAVIDSD